MKRIAVIIPFHNSAGFLREALRSLEVQTYKGWQCYLMDDGSTDGSAVIAQEFEKRHADRCHYARTFKNRGKAYQISQAEGMIRETYLTFLDADDTIAPTALETCVTTLDANPDAECLVTACRSMDVNGVPGNEWRWKDVPYDAMSLRAGRVSPALTVFRTDPFMDAGGIDVAFRQGQMYELRLRMAGRKPMLLIPDVLYNYRRHDNQTTAAKKHEQSEAVRKAREKHPLPKVKAR